MTIHADMHCLHIHTCLFMQKLQRFGDHITIFGQLLMIEQIVVEYPKGRVVLMGNTCAQFGLFFSMIVKRKWKLTENDPDLPFFPRENFFLQSSCEAFAIRALEI